MPSTAIPDSSVRMTEDMLASKGHLVTRSGRSVWRQQFLKPAVFPFMKLPGEIRNMIYRFALTGGATSKGCGHRMGFIPIEDICPHIYGTRKRNGKPYRRSTYSTPSHGQCDLFFHNRNHRPCNETTTYTLRRSVTMSGLGLLRTDRQTRADALPIFYGENTFWFGDTYTVIPFLKDRPNTTRQMIRRVDLSFEVYDCDDFHPRRQSGWVKTMSYLNLFMNLTTLTVAALDRSFDLMGPFQSSGPKQGWLRALAQVRGLNEIYFSVTFSERESFIEGAIEHVLATTFSDDEIDDKIQDELRRLLEWEWDIQADYQLYLEARCLKKRQMTLDEWLERHVCSSLCSCREVRKGRAARRRRLPKSETDGSWVLPEVDYDSLYDREEDDPDFTDDEYADNEDGFSEDDLTEEDASALSTHGVDRIIKCT